MSVEIEDNTYQIENDVENAVALTLRLAIEDIHRRSNNITPLKNNALRTSVLKTMPTKTRGVIEWRVPYAAYQERGMRADGTHVVQNYTTPGTGKEYAKRSVEATMKNFQEIAKQGGLI